MNSKANKILFDSNIKESFIVEKCMGYDVVLKKLIIDHYFV